MRETGRERLSCRLFDEMDRILGHRLTSVPLCFFSLSLAPMALLFHLRLTVTTAHTAAATFTSAYLGMASNHLTNPRTLHGVVYSASSVFIIIPDLLLKPISLYPKYIV